MQLQGQGFPFTPAWMEKLPAELTAKDRAKMAALTSCSITRSNARVQPANSSFQVEILHTVFRKYTNTFTHGDTRKSADGNINFLLKIPMRLCVV